MGFMPSTGDPVVLQLDAADCGVASLANILRHYGKDVSLAELRDACGQPGDHRRASGLVRAAQNYGLQSRATRCHVQMLQEHPYLLPAIALWENNRFLVVERLTKSSAFLQDPRSGVKEVTSEKFAQSFSNVAIFVTPQRNFQAVPTLSKKQSKGDSLQRQLQKGVRGEVSSFSKDHASYQRDFGGIVSRRPRLIVRASCEDDVVHVLQVAQSANVPVRFRGAGHSCQGQSLAEGGILLVNSADHVDYEMLDEERVLVTTRSRWHYLEQELNRIGRSFPVLTDNPTTTIGGTLSVGGYGPRSIAHGAQVMQVEQVRLILPSGEAVWCSPEKNQELFQYSLAGLGQVGLMEKVVLRTVPRFPQTIWYQEEYPDLFEMAAVLQSLATHRGGGRAVARPDAFMAYQISGQGLYACYGFDRAHGTNASAPLELELQSRGVSVSQTPANLGYAYRQNWSPDAYCPAVDYFVDAAQLPAFLGFLDDRLRTDHLAPYIHGLLILAVHRPQDRSLPFEAASFGANATKFLVGFYPIIPAQDLAGLEKVQALLRETLALCLQLGGRPYLYGWHDLTEPAKRRLYDPHYSRLQTLRAHLDPHRLVNHGVF